MNLTHSHTQSTLLKAVSEGTGLRHQLNVRRLQPLGDRVLVRRTEAPSSSSSQEGRIVLPDSATEKLPQGVVVAVGPGARNPASPTAARVAPALKPGDKVLLPDFGGVQFKAGPEKYALFSESDILCVLADE